MERKNYSNPTSEEHQTNPLEGLREELDSIDNEILKLLAKRMSVAKKVGEYKKNRSVPLLDRNRWTEVMNSRIKEGKKLGLSGELVAGIYEPIHQESLNIQQKVQDEEEK